MGKRAKLARQLLAELPEAPRGAWSGLTADEQAMIEADAKYLDQATQYWGAGFGGEGLRFLAGDHTVISHRVVNGKVVKCAPVAVAPGAHERLAAVDDVMRHVKVWVPAGRPLPDITEDMVDGRRVVYGPKGKIERIEDLPPAPEHNQLDPEMHPRLQDATAAVLNARAANRPIRSTPVEPVGDKAGVRWGHEHGTERSINDPAPKHRKPKGLTKAQQRQVAEWSAELNAARKR